MIFNSIYTITTPMMAKWPLSSHHRLERFRIDPIKSSNASSWEGFEFEWLSFVINSSLIDCSQIETIINE